MLYKMADSESTGKDWFNFNSASEHFLIIFKHFHSRPGTGPEDFLPHSEYLSMFSERSQKYCKRYIFYSQSYSQNKQCNTPTTRSEKSAWWDCDREYRTPTMTAEFNYDPGHWSEHTNSLSARRFDKQSERLPGHNWDHKFVDRIQVTISFFPS
jgi:hypothetical protein